MLHAVSLGAVLSVLWLLLSGYFEPLLLGLGAASVVVVVALSHRMDVIDREGHPIHIGWNAALYMPWLAKEIWLSNLHVAGVILRRAMPIEPRVFTVRASQGDELGQVVYANSITLTPGTITIGVDGDRLLVHALTAATRDGLETGDMDRRVTVMMEGTATPAREGR